MTGLSQRTTAADHPLGKVRSDKPGAKALKLVVRYQARFL